MGRYLVYLSFILLALTNFPIKFAKADERSVLCTNSSQLSSQKIEKISTELSSVERDIGIIDDNSSVSGSELELIAIVDILPSDSFASKCGDTLEIRGEGFDLIVNNLRSKIGTVRNSAPGLPESKVRSAGEVLMLEDKKVFVQVSSGSGRLELVQAILFLLGENWGKCAVTPACVNLIEEW